MEAVNNVSILSSQLNLPYKTITSSEEIPKLNPSYIVIATNTALHHRLLTFLEENLQGRKILVEKPLFDSFYNLEIKNNQVYVGYNLRFHPLIQLIREKIIDKKLWNIQVFCGSYLPDWRPGRDYRTTASARKETGGGVLLDLSHELDYVQWLVGAIDLRYVKSKKISDLDIETDDLLLLSGKSKNGAHVHISLNYFTRKPIRQIIIDGEGISIQADLIANTIKLYDRNEPSELSWLEFERNNTYLEQHRSILNNDFSRVCTYKEGLETMRLIDCIKSFNQV
jgi:CMP-N,N'-diacetyllegionaminic acid synthase